MRSERPRQLPNQNPNRHDQKNTKPLILAAIGAISLSAFFPGMADESSDLKCFYTGAPAKAGVKIEYEGVTYGFSSEANLKKFEAERAASLYQQIGGKAALSAAVDLFYVKVLADERVNHFFEDVNMKAQQEKQKAFLAAALGAPTPWTGKDIRKAHANLDLRESDFAAIAETLEATLTKLKLSEELIGRIMAIVASTRNDVLNR